MPSRFIKESIWTSPNLARLSPRAELHFYRLLPVPDDYGCFESTASVIRGRCYPLNESIRSKDVQQWQDELEQNGLIMRWQLGGREFAIFPSWQKHQYIRNAPHQRRTPEPPETIIERCNQLLTGAYGDLPQVTEGNGLFSIPIPTPIKENNIKEKYGEFNNVLLSIEEYKKLKAKFPDLQDRIEALSLWMKSNGKAKKDHYATILNWARRDKVKSADPGPGVPEV